MTLNRVQKPNMKIKKRKTTSIIMGASISHISSKFNFTAHNLAKHALQLDSESSWIEKSLTMRRIFKANSIFWFLPVYWINICIGWNTAEGRIMVSQSVLSITMFHKFRICFIMYPLLIGCFLFGH